MVMLFLVHGNNLAGQKFFFASSKEDQAKACTTSGFLMFWSAIVSNKQFAMCLRLYATIIVLACP